MSPQHSRRVQAPSEFQLLVLLKYLGSQGIAASNTSLASHFQISIGTAEKYRKRAARAVLSLEANSYHWPDDSERRTMSIAIQKKWFFPNCVGFMDGTLLPLEFKPKLHGETYYSRKGFFSINMLIICNHNAHILYYMVGWPGSVHDHRVWRNSKMFRNVGDYFNDNEYLLADSAFSPSAQVVPAFKKSVGGQMDPNCSKFNDLLATARVKSEHCIGLLKGRFPWLKNIRIKIRSERSLRRIISFVRIAVILHNALVNAPYDESWIDEDFLELDDDDELNMAVEGNMGGATRREQLLHYLSEVSGTGIL